MAYQKGDCFMFKILKSSGSNRKNKSNIEGNIILVWISVLKKIQSLAPSLLSESISVSRYFYSFL